MASSWGLDDVELATLEWVDWHNHRRLHSACPDLTPTEYELIHYGQHPALTEVWSLKHLSLPTRLGDSLAWGLKQEAASSVMPWP